MSHVKQDKMKLLAVKHSLMIEEGLEFYYCGKEVEKWTSGVVAAKHSFPRRCSFGLSHNLLQWMYDEAIRTSVWEVTADRLTVETEINLWGQVLIHIVTISGLSSAG